MGAVQWWDHSRVWLDEYDQSLKICKSMNIFYQPNPPKEILLRIKRSFLEQNRTKMLAKQRLRTHKIVIRKINFNFCYRANRLTY